MNARNLPYEAGMATERMAAVDVEEFDFFTAD